MMDTIYRERANGRWEYWTYAEGRRVYVAPRWAYREIHRKTAKLVDVLVTDRVTEIYRRTK